MEITREDQKREAIARMKQIGIFPETIRQFERDGYVSISEPPLGAFYWAEGEDLERIRKFESENDATVYCVIRTYYRELGVMESYLYVGKYPEELDDDGASLNVGETCAYVYNRDDPDLSEFGYIGFELTPAAGLRRTW